MVARLETLIADAIFGWRQIVKHRGASAAAIVSLALGIGASMAAFQLIDALFLRPLPIAHPERLYEVNYPNSFEGKIETIDAFNYAAFRPLQQAVKGQASLLAISRPWRIDMTLSSDQEMERAYAQYVSGSMFAEFGIKPALGRLLTDRDDVTPGVAPYAVISYGYWSRRFGRDRNVIGRWLRTGNDSLQIVGVAPAGFTGTDPGMFTDIFIPNMMNPFARKGTFWNAYRAFFVARPGANLDEIRDRITGALHTYREEDVKTWTPERRKAEQDLYLTAAVSLEPAATGRSTAQHGYQRALLIFAVLVGLVLLIACANVANLRMAQAAARTREMAMRISIGAGRGRLIQLALIESALIAIAASVSGLIFAWWAGPFVIQQLNAPDRPVALTLSVNWRVTAFALALTFVVTMLLGLGPALRASSVRPLTALKGDDQPGGRRRLMGGLVAAQVAFCLFVLFVAGLFISTFDRMANQPTGFSAARVLTIESGGGSDSSDVWYQTARYLRSLPGVESAAVSQWALMSNNARTRYVWANGHSPDGTWSNSTWFLGVSPGWFETMKLPLLGGRDFRWDDAYPNVAIVNQEFAQRYFGGASAVGQSFETTAESGQQGTSRISLRIVGVVGDARYEDMRLPVPATAYVPFRALSDSVGVRATFLVRTKTADPMSLASVLRQKIAEAYPQIRVATIMSQQELVRLQMIRESLLAALALFFAAVALLLAAVGLYGVLNYGVLERRREFGIRIALGAASGDIAWRVTLGSLAMIALGAAIGLWLGATSERYVAGLLYEVKATDPRTLAWPVIAMAGAAILAAVPPVLRATRIDPAELLRTE